jgi:hypothetical protein
MRASVNTAQAPFVIFLVEEDLEDIPSSLPTPAPTSEDTPNMPLDGRRPAPQPTQARSSRVTHLQYCRHVFCSREAQAHQSSISPSLSAIEARTRAGSSVNIARGFSTLRHDTPGEVLDAFSLADTFLAQPPPLVSVSAVVSDLVPSYKKSCNYKVSFCVGCVAGIPTCEDVVRFLEAKISCPHGNSQRKA